MAGFPVLLQRNTPLHGAKLGIRNHRRVNRVFAPPNGAGAVRLTLRLVTGSGALAFMPSCAPE